MRVIPRIIDFIGYCPYESPESLAEKIVTTRQRLGLSKRKLAAQLGVDPATLTNWEEGRREPRGKWAKIVRCFLCR